MENENNNVNENNEVCENQYESQAETESGEQYEEQYALQPEREDNTANILCIVSAVLMYGANPLLISLFKFAKSRIAERGPSIFSKFFEYSNLFYFRLSCICPLIGFILMIILRVKYPKHAGGKALMIVTIVVIVLSIISLIALIATCCSIISSCPG